jgi:hypothetical protein
VGTSWRVLGPDAKSGHSQIGHWACEKRDFTCEIRPLEGLIRLGLDGRGQTIISPVKFAQCPIPMRSDLADRMVELGHVEQISHETIRQTLKKTN